MRLGLAVRSRDWGPKVIQNGINKSWKNRCRKSIPKWGQKDQKRVENGAKMGPKIMKKRMWWDMKGFPNLVDWPAGHTRPKLWLPVSLGWWLPVDRNEPTGKFQKGQEWNGLFFLGVIRQPNRVVTTFFEVSLHPLDLEKFLRVIGKSEVRAVSPFLILLTYLLTFSNLRCQYWKPAFGRDNAMPWPKKIQ